MEIFKKQIEKSKIQEINLEDNKISVVTDKQQIIEIETNHEPVCCEVVYADMEIFKYVKKELIGKTIDVILIKGVEEMGFLVCLGELYRHNDYFDYFSKIFIPCYNVQNGYYSSDLELKISVNGIETKIDISNLAEDHID